MIMWFCVCVVFQSMSQAVAIIQRFPFSSALQRMSVVTVGPGGQGATAFLKGAPEMVASHCLKESGKGGKTLGQVFTLEVTAASQYVTISC